MSAIPCVRDIIVSFYFIYAGLNTVIGCILCVKSLLSLNRVCNIRKFSCRSIGFVLFSLIILHVLNLVLYTTVQGSYK